MRKTRLENLQRGCHQCIVRYFGGLLGPRFNTLDLFASLSIHLAGFLHVGLICYFFFFFLFFQKVSQSLCSSWAATAHAGGQTWLCVQETLAAGPGYLWLRFLSVKPRAGSRCARDDNAAACPRQPLCNQLSSLCPCAGALLSLRPPSLDT